MSFTESLGLIVNLTLGGLAMFFIVLMLSFIATKLIVKQNRRSIDFRDIENDHILRDPDDDYSDVDDNDENDNHEESDDIFIISERVTDNEIIDEDALTHQIEDVQTNHMHRKTLNISNLLRLTTLKKFK